MDAESLVRTVRERFPNLTGEGWVNRGDATVAARREGIRALCEALRSAPGLEFNLLADLTAVDYLHWEEKSVRFEAVYNLYSIGHKHRLFLKVPVPESEPSLDSVTSVWPAANWFEREVWDLFGIRFKGHPQLKRILMYEEFQGHPLRKDYPYQLRQPLVGPQN